MSNSPATRFQFFPLLIRNALAKSDYSPINVRINWSRTRGKVCKSSRKVPVPATSSGLSTSALTVPDSSGHTYKCRIDVNMNTKSKIFSYIGVHYGCVHKISVSFYSVQVQNETEMLCIRSYRIAIYTGQLLSQTPTSPYKNPPNVLQRGLQRA